MVKRTGQESFQYGDYYAYSKICTHVGCPVSLYEQQTGRVLCPCHQSQFDVMYGPCRSSARPPGRCRSCPSTVDDEGYFVAKGISSNPSARLLGAASA